MSNPNFQQLRAPLYENKPAPIPLCNNSAGCGNPAIKKDKDAINSFFKNETLYNVSKILDDLLANYDPIQRPNCFERGKPPTVVFVDIYVRSMSRITELDMEYKFECYFRQKWVDPRLSYKLGPSVLPVNIKMLERLWKPDTFFVNSYSANVSCSVIVLVSQSVLKSFICSNSFVSHRSTKYRASTSSSGYTKMEQFVTQCGMLLNYALSSM